MNNRRTDLPMQTRLAPISSVDAKTRTAELVFSTGARVKRYDWERGNFYLEELSLKPEHVRLGRLQSGAPLLDTHNRWSLSSVLGVVEGESVRVDGKEGRATVRFSQREEVNPVFADVEAKILRNVSAGYITYRIEMLPPDEKSEGLPIYRAVDWEPMEISLVPIGADAGAGVRSGEQPQQRTYPCEFVDTINPAATATTREEPSMTPEEKLAAEKAAAEKLVLERREAEDKARAEATAAERARVQTIRTLCGQHKLDRAFEDGLVNDDKVSVEVARERVLAELAKKTEQTEIRSGHQGIETISDETVNRRAAIVGALMHRAAPERNKLEEPMKPWRGYTLRELMRKCLEIRGVRTEGMSVVQMWERTYLSGSDLPQIVLDVANKSLRQAYESSPRTFQPWTRRTTAPDFKNMNRIMLSDAPALLSVAAGGEYKRGVLSDGKESYALATYGRIVGINRQTVINDDMDAFTRLPALMARAAADMESDTVYNILTSTSTTQMSDGVAIFGTGSNRGANLAGTGTAIDVTSLGAGRGVMRKQQSLASRPLNLKPSYLIVPAAKESIAEQYTSSAYVAALSSSVNPFAQGGRNALVPVPEPRLDAVSATAWYLAASTDQVDTIEYAYLEGQEGVYLESRMGFDVDGIELKIREDFAAKCIDFRGLYKNPGA